MTATSPYLNRPPRSLAEAQADRDAAIAADRMRNLRPCGVPVVPRPSVEIVKRRDAEARGLSVPAARGLPIYGRLVPR